MKIMACTVNRSHIHVVKLYQIGNYLGYVRLHSDAVALNSKQKYTD